MSAGVAISFLLLTLSAEPDPPARLEDLVAEAIKRKESGDLAGTLRLLNAAIAIQPHFKLFHNKARVLEELGSYREAAEAYRTVIADPTTPENVRAGDAALLALLEPKLHSAHLLSRAPPDVSVFVDQEPIGRTLTIEPGRHRIEARSERVVRMTAVELPAGTTTELSLSFDAPSRARCAVLALEGARARFSSLAVDGALLRGGPASAAEVWLDEGEHTVEVLESGVPRTNVIRPERGKVVQLVDLFPPPPAQAAEDNARVSWTAVAAGGAALGLGSAAALLYRTAASDRSRILGSPREGEVTVGLTMREADELVAGAANKVTLGSVALAGAVAFAGAAVVLWLRDAP